MNEAKLEVNPLFDNGAFRGLTRAQPSRWLGDAIPSGTLRDCSILTGLSRTRSLKSCPGLKI